MPDPRESTVVLRFAQTRTSEGSDVAVALREGFGDDIDLRAETDAQGAVTAYVVTLHFDDPDKATTAAFEMRDRMLDAGFRLGIDEEPPAPPRFAHDCERCVYLGHVETEDAYACPQSGWPTVVLRFADDEEAYRSAPEYVGLLPSVLAIRANELMRRWRDA